MRSGQALPICWRVEEQISQIDAQIRELSQWPEKPDVARDPARQGELDELGRQWDALNSDATPSPVPPKYGSYVLPGGENYRELLLTLPSEGQHAVRYAEGKYRLWDNKANDWVRGPDGKLRTRLLYDRQAEAEQAASGLNQTSGLNPMGSYISPHWDEPNTLAHVRFDDRVTDGKKTLHIAEVQSDWHQQGRKRGYQGERPEITSFEAFAKERGYTLDQISAAFRKASDPVWREWDELNTRQVEQLREYGKGVPDAPFKTTWPELALKRMIRYAAENGYDRISWDTGDTSADRYDLSKRISRVAYVNETLSAWDHQGSQVISHSGVKREQLPDYIGKEAADKLLATEPKQPPQLPDVKAADLTVEEREHDYVVRNKDGRQVEVGKGTVTSPGEARYYAVRYLNNKANEINLNRVNEYGRIGPTYELTGVDLKVGGEGMRGFYDKILPAAANKLVKKFGGKVGQSEFKTLDQTDRDVPFTVRDHDGVVVETDIQDENYAAQRAREIGGSYGFDETAGETKAVPVHSLDITPQLKDAAINQGFPLFQEAKGRIRIRLNAAILLRF